MEIVLPAMEKVCIWGLPAFCFSAVGLAMLHKILKSI